MPEITRIDRLARFGYLARGFVYILLGYVALQTRGKAEDGHDAVFELVQDMPAGIVVLWLLVFGLVCYGLYKASAALFDLECAGHEAKGVATRIGQAAGAIAYLFMAWGAYKFTADLRQTAEAQGSSGAEMAGTVLDMTAGSMILGVVALGFFVAAALQLVNAYTAGFMKHMAPGAPKATEVIGRVGFAARGVVFALVAWSLVKSAWSGQQGEARDLGGVLADLRSEGAIYIAIAAGLMLFGLFSLIASRYRAVSKATITGEARRKIAEHS